MKSKLMELIQKAFPQAIADVSDETAKGFWVNIDNAGKKATVEYHEGRGFGISDITEVVSYGEGHDMVTEGVDDVVGLLENIFGKTKPA